MSLADQPTEKLARFAEAMARFDRLDEMDLLEGSLLGFVEAAWRWVDSAEYQRGWAVDAICDHLQAVTDGHIRKLLINVPPRCTKPVWENEFVVERIKGRIPLKDVVVGDLILTHRGRFRRVTGVHQQGELPVLRIETWAGRTVRTAHDHPFLTTEGWKAAGDLRIGDHVGVVSPLEGCGYATVAAHEARLMGYLIGDGTISSGNQPRVTTGSEEISQDIEVIAAKMGWFTRCRPNSRNSWNVIIKSHPKRWNTALNGQAPFRAWLNEHRLSDTNSYTKRVPSCIMGGTKEIVSEFLGAYWSCDGYISRRGEGRTDFIIGCDSVSRELLSDIQHLLLRLGIFSRIRQKRAKLKTKRQGGDTYISWSASLSTSDDVAKFAKSVSIRHTKVLQLVDCERTNFDTALRPDEVTAIYDDGPRLCRCLTVEEDASFTAADIAVSNTTLCSIMWQAWTWARRERTFLSGPGVRFICGSYGSSLSLVNATAQRRLVLSPWYQERWGGSYTLREDQNTKGKYDTSGGGTRISTSVGGSLLGMGYDIAVCFPYDELVLTERGLVPIGRIVEVKEGLKVWSVNLQSGVLELRPVTGWHTNPGRPLIEIETDDGSTLRCTEDHRILTELGYVRAGSMQCGLRVLAALGWVLTSASDVAVSERQIEVSPSAAVPDVGNGAHAHTIFGGKGGHGVIVATCNFANKLLGKMRSAIAERAVVFAVGNVLGARSVFKVVQSWVGSVAVHMAAFLPSRTCADECSSHHLMSEAVVGSGGFAHGDPWVAFIEDGCEYFAIQGAAAIEAWPINAAHAPKAGDLVQPLKADDRKPTLRTVVRVSRAHDVPSATYCLTVSGNGNMCCGDGLSSIVCSNCDDPHNLQEAESDADRETVRNWWREISSTRMNDPKQSALVVVMQRLHEEDISGVIMQGDDADDWEHLMIPMRHDEGRHCVTSLWQDPRTVQGELMWPERFGEREVASLERSLGPYFASGRLQQMPTPDRGGIFDRDWWQLYESADGKFPPLDYVVASLDGAFTEKEENDPSGLTVWGCYMVEGKRRIILLHAWRKHLKFSSARVEQGPREHPDAYRRRTMANWGLLEWINDTCNRFKVDTLLIEAAGPGISAAQTLQDRYGNAPWGIQLVPVKGDKVARALAVQPTFAQLMVYAPARDWSQMVIDEMAIFPKGRYDDLTDSATQAMKYLRLNGLADTDDETYRAGIRAAMHKPQVKPIYPV